MRNLFSDFFSHRALFYGLFSQAGKNVVQMAELLANAVNTVSIEEREQIFKHINKLEEAGDDITHKVYLGLDKVFFTPLNRKDIHILASAIDDVADNVHEAAGRIQLYNIDRFMPAINEIAGYIKRSCAELQKLICSLSKIENAENLLASCRLVKEYEHESANVYNLALADLFANEKDPIALIKHRDILFSMEASAHKCRNATDAIEIIILNSL
jgi:predicted phosphate transport protein (TIGR00153 family)